MPSIVRYALTGIVLLAFLAVNPMAAALDITVDGSLSDWGVATPTQVNGNNWTPTAEVEAWWSEDSVGSNGYVGPGYGGQNSDIEAMFAYLDGSNLYIAIATGLEQSGLPWGSRTFKPGDVFLDFGMDGWDTAVGVGGAHAAGNVYTGTGTWWTNPDADQFPGTGQYAANTALATRIYPNAQVVYTDTRPGTETSDRWNDHNIIELCLGLSESQLASLYDNGMAIHWTLQCGNDVANLNYHPERNVVPEPASLLLMGLGLAGVVTRKLKKK
ncbi:MAG: PEP-CTERM sorting domain-containing protein [FCB group bacterium]|jgi:hypothetical protein|nr:PEP-CTERM sorting domain-containing protein [FCB group bacterium]